MRLLTVGSVAFDAVETPFGKTGRIVGGAGTYIGLSASYFTSSQGLISVVGDDFPKATLDSLRNRGIDTTGIQVKEGEKTFFWAGKYHRDMNIRDTLTTELNVLEHFDPVIPEDYQGAEVLMLGNLAPSVQKKVIQHLRQPPQLIVMDTMNFWMETAWEELKETIRLVDVLIINDEEARQLSGEYTLVKAAKKILDEGPRCVIVKKGEHGAFLFDRAHTFFCPALPLEKVVDPTGAGDTFAGGWVGYLCKSGDISLETMKSAVVAGSAMASFCVEQFGTEGLMHLSQEKIDKRVQQFVQLVDFNMETVT